MFVDKKGHAKFYYVLCFLKAVASDNWKIDVRMFLILN